MRAGQLFNSRLLAALIIGFSSGLPVALTSTTLQAWFTEANIDVVTIGALSLVGIPYILKFLWAPAVDFYQIPFGRRGWILLTQFTLVITLLVMANLNPQNNINLLVIAALMTAFFSATQDISVDAYRADILPAEERGLGSAYYVFSYRLAMLLSSGIALIMADYWGFKLTYELMALFMFLSMLPMLKLPAEIKISSRQTNYFAAMYSSLIELLQREQITLLLLFVVLYKIGDAFVLQLMTNFLLHGLGFTLTEVGVAYKMVSFFATIAGAIIGGMILLRLSLFRALLTFGLAQAFSNLMFVLLAIAGKNFALMAISIFIENFCSGLTTAAFMAFLMSLCHRDYTAGQYALLSAIASIGRIFLGPLAGILVKEFGWVQFFIWSFVASFPGLMCLLMIKQKVVAYAKVVVE